MTYDSSIPQIVLWDQVSTEKKLITLNYSELTKKIAYFKDILVPIRISYLEKFVGEKNFNTLINKKCKMSVKIET